MHIHSAGKNTEQYLALNVAVRTVTTRPQGVKYLNAYLRQPKLGEYNYSHELLEC
jgi:hypothetical protein